MNVFDWLATVLAAFLVVLLFYKLDGLHSAIKEVALMNAGALAALDLIYRHIDKQTDDPKEVQRAVEAAVAKLHDTNRPTRAEER